MGESAELKPAIRAILSQSQVLGATRILPALNAEMAKEEGQLDAILAQIHQDPVLARRVIDVANSAWFGGTVKADTVAVAFQRLGLDEFYQVTVAAVLHFHLSSGASPEFARWWNESETTARIGELLAQLLDPTLLKPSFFLGLLHDCAVPLLLRHVPDYSYLAADAFGVAPAGIEMEMECNQFTHCEVGAALSTFWQFPPEYAEVIRHHHGQTLEVLASSREQRLAAILHLAKRTPTWADQSAGLGFNHPEESVLELDIANAFRLTKPQLAEIITEIVRLSKIRKPRSTVAG